MSSRLWILLVVFMMMPVSCKEPAQASKKGGGSQNANPETDPPATRPDPVEEEEEEEEEKDTKTDKCKNKKKDDKKDEEEEEDDSLELRLAGKKPSVKEPKKRSTVAAFSLLATVNYKDDVESILSDKCVSCHSGDDKYALDTYTKAKKIKDDILSEIESGKMPPKNKAPLTSLEKKTIKEWVEAGAPENSSSGSSSDDEEEEEEEEDKKDDKDDDCDDDDNKASTGDWDDLLKPKEVEKCKDDDKIFDRLAEKCHKAKIASFDCTKSGVLAKFKEYSINVEKQYDEFVDGGYKLDQCGEYNKEPIVFFYKKKEEKEELKLLIKKLCKKGSAACDN